jgi:hypothetical protein
MKKIKNHFFGGEKNKSTNDILSTYQDIIISNNNGITETNTNIEIRYKGMVKYCQETMCLQFWDGSEWRILKSLN